MENNHQTTSKYSPEQVRSERKKFFGRLDIRLAILFFSLSFIALISTTCINYFVLQRFDDYADSRKLYERVDGKWMQVETYEPTRLDPIITALEASMIVFLVAGIVSFTSYPWFKSKKTPYTYLDKIVR